MIISKHWHVPKGPCSTAAFHRYDRRFNFTQKQIACDNERVQIYIYMVVYQPTIGCIVVTPGSVLHFSGCKKCSGRLLFRCIHMSVHDSLCLERK